MDAFKEQILRRALRAAQDTVVGIEAALDDGPNTAEYILNAKTDAGLAYTHLGTAVLA